MQLRPSQMIPHENYNSLLWVFRKTLKLFNPFQCQLCILNGSSSCFSTFACVVHKQYYHMNIPIRNPPHTNGIACIPMNGKIKQRITSYSSKHTHGIRLKVVSACVNESVIYAMFVSNDRAYSAWTSRQHSNF